MGILKKLFNIKEQKSTETFGSNYYDSFAEYEAYQKIVMPFSSEYYKLSEEIRTKWSVMYNLGNFNFPEYEDLCIKAIAVYKEMIDAELMYSKIYKKDFTPPTHSEAFKRLAMYYEKHQEYEKAIEVCKSAIIAGQNEIPRLARMLKKAKRNPTEKEMLLLQDLNK